MYTRGARLRRRTTKTTKFVAAIAIGAMLAAACGSDDSTSEPQASSVTSESGTADAGTGDPIATDAVSVDVPSDGSAATGQDLPAGTYTFGYIGIEGGPVAYAGIPVGHGVELAVEQINEQGFLGPDVTLKVIREDTAADPAKAITYVNRFIDDDDVLGVVCCLISGEAGAVMPLLEAAGMPAITTVALLDGLNNPPYLYRTQLLPGQPGGAHEQLIAKLIDATQPQTAAIAVTADSQGQMAELPSWVDTLEDHGVEVVLQVDTLIADQDFTGPATQIIDKNPDVFINSMYGETGALMIKALRDRGYEGEIVSNYGISAADNYEIAGEALDGAAFPVPFYAGSELPAAQAFSAAYEERYGEAPDTFSVNGYVATWFLATGLRNAPEPTREGLATGLSNVEVLEGTPIGDLHFVDGQAELAAFLFIAWQDGEQVLWEP